MVLNSEKYQCVNQKNGDNERFTFKDAGIEGKLFFDSHLKIKYIQKIYRKLNALGSISTFLNNDHF